MLIGKKVQNVPDEQLSAGLVSKSIDGSHDEDGMTAEI
jgi:hypothetical protein